jgi:uncharacterized protein (UPF0332 family)
MSLAEELLTHARFLANLDPRTTSQANIRRAISAAYYAVFHLIAADVGAQVSPDLPAGLRERTQRALDHRQMLKVAKAFSQAGASRAKDLPDDIVLPVPVSQELASISNSFKELQEARHTADYDVLQLLDPAYAQTLVQQAEKIFQDWKTERNSRNAPVFLAALMFGKDWNK